MAFVTRDEWLAQQANRENRAQNSGEQRSRVGYFSLKNDGDEAIVRFVYNDPSEFEIYTVHPVTKGGKFRRVNCINDLKAGIHNCPLCAAGVQLQNKFYIRLIEYVRDDQGNIIPYARVWERPTSYIQTLANLFSEYGPLNNSVFKIKRSGAPGDMKTTYNIMYSNPSIYNEQLYPKDFSAFDGYKILGTAILDESALEMEATAVEMGLTVPKIDTQPVMQQTPVQNVVLTNTQPQFNTPQFNTSGVRTPVYGG